MDVQFEGKLDFKVSVIIPVYNAELYIEHAVVSAVNLDEVGEIILIEDGSKDNSLSICKELVDRFGKIKLLTHENNVNKGASESRNLGIRSAIFPFVSFLDADDVYDVSRFRTDKSILASNNAIDGVYSAVGYLDEEDGKMFYLRKVISPNELFHFLLIGTYGHFHTNGITLRKSVFDDVGYFSSQLILHQDSEMWLRIALKKKLISGDLKNPVALIRRHEGNRIWKGQNYSTKYLLYVTFYNWVLNENISKYDLLLLLRRISIYESKKNNKLYYLLLIKNCFKGLLKLKIN
ncbi:glycosyltransferase family 2 protein [Flavobacterium sp.]|jgi:glycosyltransferase involved in cell wall biosynthesis|uniref:glycosyltransferase family 2 protein n=1 Tax=Flavobacterium sp. TaxID=239 RepID=UPI0037BF9CE6